ncbi:MAG: membrane dipeptidase [Firmicutes bacterium]|nr:membrane dipeptidase [Bacillota bacterium]
MKPITLTKAQEERARELHEKYLFIDCLCGNMVNPEPQEIDGVPYLERVLRSGVNVQSITLSSPAAGFEEVLHDMYGYYNLFKYHPDKVMQIKTVDDIKTAKETGRVGVIFNLQNSIAMGPDFYKWSIMAELGLKICQLTYMEPNLYGSGCLDKANGGLTYWGEQAVREMNRQGIVVDLSHVGERTSLEAIDASSKPCIFSHSNSLTVCSTSNRNLTDEMIRNCAAKGGVICLNAHGFVCHKEVGVQGTLEDYMAHFEYLGELVGPDHMGIGTDIFEYYTKQYWECKTKLLYNSPWMFETVFNRDMKRVDQYINITRGLVALGFTDEDIEKILGGSLVRVFKEVWR